MNHKFYFDGRQIKNYLVGFASLFSEIPYKNRRGVLESVPIHYGSPSDIISHLEMNVDNDETKNRNRLKDVSVPLFSFRMTGMEKNTEKRRAAHDSITVDLRPLGYSTGYVTMRPTPIRFTMELICWASSDYQAFEISEQIIPYFNSPQQVSIEPLPRSPVSTTEIFLDSVEIDTEPESRRYSAMITMSFNLTGYLLTQPRIWSTNMKFEFSMLDKEYQGTDTPVNLDDTDYSVGHEIVETNSKRPGTLPHEDRIKTIDGFILNTPKLLDVYGEKYDIYNLLLEHGRISKDRQIIDHTPLVVEYKGKEITIGIPMMELVIDDMTDIEFLYTNEFLKDALKKHTIRDDLVVMDKIFSVDSDLSNNIVGNKTQLDANIGSIDLYLKLLDNNLVTKGFNRTEVSLSNSDKLNMFGTTRIDIDEHLDRLKSYLAGIENLKIKKPIILDYNILDNNTDNKEYDIIILDTYGIPFENFPDEHKVAFNRYVSQYKKDIRFINAGFENSKTTLQLLIDRSYVKPISVNQGNNSGEIQSSIFNISRNFDDTIEIEVASELNKIIVVSTSLDVDEPGFNAKGILLIDPENKPNLSDLAYLIDGVDYSAELIKSDEIYKLFNGKEFLNSKFIDLDDYLVSSLLYEKIKSISISENKSFEEVFETDPSVKIYKNKYKTDMYAMLKMYGNLRILVESIRNNIEIISPKGINPVEFNQKQQNIAPDLSQTIATDNNGKAIYDVNGDGYINQEDLKILGSEVDNPEDFDHVLRYGVWYKNFNLDKMPEERIKRIMSDLKVLFYLTEKTDFSELKEYLILLEKDFVTNGFDLYDDEQKLKEIKALGYNTDELDDKLLFMRLFVDAIKNIMVKEREFIIHFVPDMNEESKRMLYMESGLDIDKIVIGKFLDLYFNSITNSDQRVEDMTTFKRILPKMIGEYIRYSYQFDIFMYDIKQTQLFIDSLESENQWLSENLPEVEEKIKIKYLDNK